MQVSVAGLRRNIKNIAHNYTEPQKKVREATSNDPWGPSSTLMSEIADLTYNIEAFAQIMEMLWKRLNDHGKNWRHVYKSLVLLEYLIKTGSERVAQQCKENIFAIQTLKDFQYFEDNKDQGMNVREKAKQLVTLLTSEERLRNERARALKARERFAQTVSGFGSSDSNETTPTSPVFGSGFGHDAMNGGHGRSSSSHRVNPELENARPQTVGEEELQLQLALAMSKEEADQEEKRRRSDDLKLQMALSQSEDEVKTGPDFFRGGGSSKKMNDSKNSSALVDLLDVDLGGAAGLEAQGAVGGIVGPDPWAAPQKQQSSTMLMSSMSSNSNHHHHNNLGGGGADPWSGASSTLTSPQDPWYPNSNGGGAGASSADPWSTSSTNHAQPADPWSPGAGAMVVASPIVEDEFDILSKRTELSSPFNLDPLGPTLLTPMNTSRSANSTPDNFSSRNNKKDPLDFLGDHSGLVNLDNLVPPAKPVANSSTLSSSSMNTFPQVNPFAAPPATSLLSSTTMNGPAAPVNPFHLQNAIAKPSINEIREKQQQVNVGNNNGFGGASSRPPANNPWSPVKENPFLG